MYTNSFQELGAETTGTRVNTSRLKERITIQVAELQCFTEGRNASFALREDLGTALKKSHKENFDDQTIYLTKVAAIIRKDILSHQYSFNGTFEHNCQVTLVPSSLLLFYSHAP